MAKDKKQQGDKGKVQRFIEGVRDKKTQTISNTYKPPKPKPKKEK
jgi:hypothetical protein